MPYIVTAIIAYLIGSVNFSVLISKKMAGFDVRDKGSGNGGTTNILRTVGKKAAILTLVADILKGVVAVLIAFGIEKIVHTETAIFVQIAAVAVVVRSYFSSVFWISRRKGRGNKFGNSVAFELGNWFDLFSICHQFDGCYQNGFSRLYFSSCVISSSYDFYS